MSNRPLAVTCAAVVCAAMCAAGCASPHPARAAAARPDAACADAARAERALETSQDKDSSDPPALGADFTAFAGRLSADARRETDPAAARAMTRLADDYTALVESETGFAQLPSMSTVESDGVVFGRACRERR